MLRSILAAVIAGTEPDLEINSEAQTYLRAELALNQAGGQGGVLRLRVCYTMLHAASAFTLPLACMAPLALRHMPGAVALIIIS